MIYIQALANGTYEYLIHSEFPHLLPERWRSVVVRGLESCHQYEVEVVYHYISYHDQVKRTKSMFPRTKCEVLSPSHSTIVLTVVVCVTIFIAGAGILVFCVFYLRKFRSPSRRGSVIDQCALTSELCVIRMTRANP